MLLHVAMWGCTCIRRGIGVENMFKEMMHAVKLPFSSLPSRPNFSLFSPPLYFPHPFSIISSPNAAFHLSAKLRLQCFKPTVQVRLQPPLQDEHEAEWRHSGCIPSLEEYQMVANLSVSTSVTALSPLFIIGEVISDEMLRLVGQCSRFLYHIGLNSRLTNDIVTSEREEPPP
ncbi:hypothetical protein AMTRI_Chr11g156920 [Amborella trichopoda]